MKGFYRAVVENAPEEVLVPIPPELRGGRVEVIVLPLASGANGGHVNEEAVAVAEMKRDAHGWPSGLLARTFGILPDLKEVERPGSSS